MVSFLAFVLTDPPFYVVLAVSYYQEKLKALQCSDKEPDVIQFVQGVLIEFNGLDTSLYIGIGDGTHKDFLKLEFL